MRLLRGETTILDEIDFQKARKHSWYLNGGYAVARISGIRTLMHRFIIGKAPKGYHTDHINRNKLDNRRINLRIVTAAVNLKNRRTYKGKDNPFYGKTHAVATRKIIGESCAIPLFQISKEGVIIKKWGSALEVERTLGISNSNINQVIHNKRKSAGGFLWRME